MSNDVRELDAAACREVAGGLADPEPAPWRVWLPVLGPQPDPWRVVLPGGGVVVPGH